MNNQDRIASDYTICVNNKKNSSKLCLILAGYKPFLWDNTLKRIKNIVPFDYDVCIVSSGRYSDKLKNIAQTNSWTYLSTIKNNVSIAQNIALCNFPQAKEIFKIDEDIFITNNFFETLPQTYMVATKKSNFIPGVIAPLIPINGVGYVNILKELNLEKLYSQRFEYPKYVSGVKTKIENSVEVAKFFWGASGEIPQLDRLNAYFETKKFEFIPTPIRFSIGAIYFKRELWEKMGMFKTGKGSGMGADELHINKYCFCKSRPILISLNSVVGHLSFTQQNQEMSKFYEQNTELFSQIL
jgi:hypothetical protein